MNNSIPQIVEGIEYLTIKAVANAYNLNENTIYKRHQRGHRGTYLIPERFRKSYKKTQSIKLLPFEVGSYRFKNVSDACRKLNIDRQKYYGRIRNGWTREEALQLIPRKDGRSSEAKQSNPTNPSSRPRRKRNNDPLNLFGHEFKNYSEISKATGLKASVLWQRVNCSNKSLEEAVLMEGKKKRVVANGSEYESFTDLANTIGIEPNRFFSLHKKFSIDDLVSSKPRLTKRSIVFRGKTYPNLKSLASEFGLGINELNYRLRRCGMTLEQALSIPRGESVVQSISRNLGTFYVAKVCDEAYTSEDGKNVYKIGVSQHKLEKRLSEFPFTSEVMFEKRGSISEMKEIEKMAKNQLRDKRFRSFSAKDFDGFTEVYTLTKSELEYLGFLMKVDFFKNSATLAQNASLN